MRRWLLFGMIILILVGCTPEQLPPPTIRFESPENGLEIAKGERVLVQSLAQDEKGVVKTELWVDGRVFEVSRPENRGSAREFAAIQIWDAAEMGPHTLTVRAFSADGRMSAPASIEVQVVQRPPTPTPPAVATPTVVVEESCDASARFVEDVTVPDDTLYNGGVNFTKVWRLRNDGECTWPVGTVWAFIGGSLLGAESPVEVERAEPGRIVDISVDMVAPASPGTYRSYWRLQTPDGAFFGDQAYVRIIVP